MERDARTAVERYLAEVLNGENDDGPDELISSATLKQRVVGFRTAFPDLRTETNVVVAAEDLVAVHLTGSGTHRGVFQGCPATGRAWTASCTAIYRLEDGRIADAWLNWDLLSILEQLRCVRRVETVSA